MSTSTAWTGPARRLERRVARHDREEVGLDEVTPRVGGELGGEREQLALVPLDHRAERVDHVQRADAGSANTARAV